MIQIKVNPHTIVNEAIEEAVVFALKRAHKHLPEGQLVTRDSLAEHLQREIWIAFEEHGIYFETDITERTDG